MAGENTIERKKRIMLSLGEFLKKAETFLNRSDQEKKLDESSSSMILYHLVHIAAALVAGDEDIALRLKAWVEEYGEKLRVGNREDYFQNSLNKINAGLERVLDPHVETGPGSGTQLDHHLDFINQIHLY